MPADHAPLLEALRRAGRAGDRVLAELLAWEAGHSPGEVQAARRAVAAGLRIWDRRVLALLLADPNLGYHVAGNPHLTADQVQHVALWCVARLAPARSTVEHMRNQFGTRAFERLLQAHPFPADGDIGQLLYHLAWGARAAGRTIGDGDIAGCALVCLLRFPALPRYWLGVLAGHWADAPWGWQRITAHPSYVSGAR